MSRFYGSMQGSRGEVTRCGTKNSGIHARVRGWNIGIVAEVRECGKCGGDRVFVGLSGGSNDGTIPGGYGFSYCECDTVRHE